MNEPRIGERETDTGLRRMLLWTLAALVLALAIAAVAVTLVVDWWGW